jgi:hypothetical protein
MHGQTWPCTWRQHIPPKHWYLIRKSRSEYYVTPRNLFDGLHTCSSWLSFVDTDTTEKQRKCVGRLMEVICLMTAVKMSGHGAVHIYKISVARFGVTIQWSHSTVNLRVKVFSIISRVNYAHWKRRHVYTCTLLGPHSMWCHTAESWIVI